jgi:hypothetical protein
MICCKNFNDLVDQFFKQAMNAATIDDEFVAKLNLMLKRLEMYEKTYVLEMNNDWSKVFQILDKIGDLKSIIKFINTTMAHMKLPTNLDFIANWLVKFGYENIMPSVIKRIQPESYKLIENCNITKVMILSNNQFINIWD